MIKMVVKLMQTDYEKCYCWRIVDLVQQAIIKLIKRFICWSYAGNEIL